MCQFRHTCIQLEQACLISHLQRSPRILENYRIVIFWTLFHPASDSEPLFFFLNMYNISIHPSAFINNNEQGETCVLLKECHVLM